MSQEEDEAERLEHPLEFWRNFRNRLDHTSGAVVGAYENLSGTLNPRQQRIVEETQFRENINTLIELTREQNRRFEEAQQETGQQARTERIRFYISTIIAVIAIIVGVLIAIFF